MQLATIYDSLDILLLATKALLANETTSFVVTNEGTVMKLLANECTVLHYIMNHLVQASGLNTFFISKCYKNSLINKIKICVILKILIPGSKLLYVNIFPLIIP